jgi:transposase
MDKDSAGIRTVPGSFGSRNGQPWSRELAKANDRTKPSDTAAGTFGPVDRIEPHIVLRDIEAQMCPWCGAGPYKVLAAHTNKAHGIDRSELRKLAGLSQSASICAPDYSEDRREAVSKRADWEETTRRANQAAVKAKAYEAAASARARKHLDENSERDALIVETVRAGAFREDVATQFGVGSKTVTAALRRAGVDDDGRQQAAKLRGWGDEKKEVMRDGFARVKNAEKAARVKRFVELGETWDALEAMANEEGRTRRQMAAVLRHAGANVPDGRAVTPYKRKVGDIAPAPKKQCSENGCERDSSTRGLCKKHYQNWRYHHVTKVENV